MSSFTISPGSYNYYVEAGGSGECFELSPLWSIVVNGNTIVSGEGVFGLTGSFEINSQSTMSLPTPTYQYAPIEYMQGMCGYTNGNVY